MFEMKFGNMFFKLVRNKKHPKDTDLCVLFAKLLKTLKVSQEQVVTNKEVMQRLSKQNIIHNLLAS